VVAAERLCRCPALASLPARRLRAAARASSEETYQAGQAIPMREDRLYVLQEGKVTLSVWLCPGTHCGGEAVVAVDQPGRLFGCRPVAKEDRLHVQAVCQELVRVIAIDLSRLRESEAGLMLREAAVGCLYALLQDVGLCPRNAADRVVLGAEECRWTDARKLVFRSERSERALRIGTDGNYHLER
jgi:hypothetical protein